MQIALYALNAHIFVLSEKLRRNLRLIIILSQFIINLGMHQYCENKSEQTRSDR